MTILSIGYGPDHQRKLRMEFGPINKEGGWRRLNVAVTRARRRMEVVASFSGGELPDSENPSVQHLKRYLQYAEHGPRMLHIETADPDAVPESPFEEDVLNVLRGWGYKVQPQVGVAGYRIDMAVRHPAMPGMYALGIECDGAMYHSSRVARDRDRLREEVLRGLGWRLHRIWGTDWYRSRRSARERLREAVEQACAADPAPEPSETGPGASPAEYSAPTPVAKVDFVPVWAETHNFGRPYVSMADGELRLLREAVADQFGLQDVELQDPRSGRTAAEVALHVVEIEGPIEEELLMARVRTAWGLAQLRAKAQEVVYAALKSLEDRRRIVRTDTSYDMPGREMEQPRTPTADVGRPVKQVPALERRLVVRNVIAENPGIHRDETYSVAAKFFGWSRVRAEIRGRLTSDLEHLIEEGTVVETPSGLLIKETS